MTRQRFFLFLLTWQLLLGGCALPQQPAFSPDSFAEVLKPFDSSNAKPQSNLTATAPAAPVPPSPLSLAACVDMAIRQHPDLLVAAAQIDSERGKLVQAGLYPNPVVAYQGDDMNSPGAGAGKQGAMVTQSIVTAGKLRLASDAAARGVEVADWKAQIKLFDVVTRVRSAFYETLTAQQQVETTKDVLRIAQDALSTAEKLAKVGQGSQPDVLRAQVELEKSKVAQSIAQERLTASWRLLATALGQMELPIRQVSGSLQENVPDYRYETIQQEVFEVSAELHTARASIAQAESALSHAQAEVVPDLQVQVFPFYNQPDRRTELLVGIGAPIPVFNRNQGNILSARANLAQAHATLNQTELQLSERLTQAFQRYISAKQQVQAYEQKILPTAQESVRLLLLAYSSGDEKVRDFNAVIDAQRSLAQARLEFVQARGELQKAVSEIEGLLQRLPAGTK